MIGAVAVSIRLRRRRTKSVAVMSGRSSSTMKAAARSTREEDERGFGRRGEYDAVPGAGGEAADDRAGLVVVADHDDRRTIKRCGRGGVAKMATSTRYTLQPVIDYREFPRGGIIASSSATTAGGRPRTRSPRMAAMNPVSVWIKS